MSAQTEISFTKTFEKKFKPDTIATSVSLSSQKLSQDQTMLRLTKVSDFVATAKYLKIKKGEYSINPHMVYDNGKSYQDGYDGSISYAVSSKNPKDLNKFIRDIQRLGDKAGLAVSIANVSWQMSDEQQSSIGSIEGLRLDAILWAKQYASTLSSKMGGHCNVSRIDFNGNQTPAYQTRALKAKVAYDGAPTPIQDEQSMQVAPFITLVCK
ncbi:MAG: SIMPL domain-containing protein [Thermoleophilia bacterium]|nr:SIMPL domain-containing protein [Thermoleophilia bacterium]